MHICLRASVVRPARLRCCPCLRDQPPFPAALRGSQCRRRSSAPQRPSRRTIRLPSFCQPHARTCPRSLALVLGDLHWDRGDSKKVWGGGGGKTKKKCQTSKPSTQRAGRARPLSGRARSGRRALWAEASGSGASAKPSKADRHPSTAPSCAAAKGKVAAGGKTRRR